MEIRANYIMVGAFAILAFIGGLIFTLWTVSQDKGVPLAEYEIAFSESVKGLSVNNDVLFSGIRVGKVTDIKISQVRPGDVKVRIAIAADTPVRKDSYAQLELRGLTGSSVVSISGGTASSPVMPVPLNGPGVIRSEPSPLTSVVSQMPDVLNAAHSLLQRLEGVVSPENAAHVGSILKSLDTLAKGLSGQTASVEEVIKSAEKASRKLAELADSAASIVDGDLKAASVSLSGMAKRANSTLAVMEPGLKQFSSQGLNDMTMLISELRNLVHMLTRTVQKIESDPRRFLFGVPIKEYQN